MKLSSIIPLIGRSGVRVVLIDGRYFNHSKIINADLEEVIFVDEKGNTVRCTPSAIVILQSGAVK